MADDIYFSKIEFREFIGYQLNSILLLNLVEGTLAYQVYEPSKIKKSPAITGIATEKFMGHTWDYELRKPAVRMRNSQTEFEPVVIEDVMEENDVVFSYAYHFSKDELIELLSYCNVADFEAYRNREMSMEDPGYCGYRDEIKLSFVGVTDSYVPLIKLPMDYYYDEAHRWPTEALYQYVITNLLNDEKLKKAVTPYGGYSLPCF